ncbi:MULTISPECIES: sulfite exporter TauE/SafE family protein [Flavobacterium]|uniref:Probable membrane transporter protein n=1 Tax=Flavobacterium hankyongi TaxID=1176532 RepID=A0ABP8ZRX6_9FLAO|nr:sulfite exporter TauE/SafE family protein [Flavobacterium sp. N1846]
MEILGYLSSVLIGISLGLIGGGGSILTIPILVYLFKINPENATSYSLFIVGTTSLLGTYKHYKLGNLQLKPALYFGIPSVISLLLTRKFILPSLPSKIFEIGQMLITKDILIMIVFSILMIFAAFSMIRKQPETINKEINLTKLIVLGLVIGIITGFLGAGGGFLIIPALVLFGNLSMKQAIGSSLFIIFINSTLGFLGDVLNGVVINYTFLISITLIASIGILIGTKLSKTIDGKKLKPAFGWFVLLMGIYIISKEFLNM